MTTIDGSLAVAGGSSGTGRDTEVSIWGGQLGKVGTLRAVALGLQG